MKGTFTLLLCFIVSVGFAQQTINDTIMHDGLQRAYILYVPASYSAGTPTPLVMNFHGYTSNSWQQMVYGDFRAVADTAGFLLVHPMGTLDLSGQPYWNAGWGGSVDDIGFTSALIDSLSAAYSVNLERVYSTGMSNGGFMSYTLACELSSEIAAIASVTGTMNSNQTATCTPSHPVPVMEIHGTSDPTVPYAGNGSTMESISNVIDYWVNFNDCNTTAEFTAVPDIDMSDGCTAEHYLYRYGNNGAEVEHYKIIGGAHTWPGAPLPIGVTNQDINASAKIWEFFNKYDINGRRGNVGIGDITQIQFSVYPNPSFDRLTLDLGDSKIETIRIFNSVGQMVYLSRITANLVSIPVQIWETGIYFIEGIDIDGNSSSIKWLKVD